MSQAGIVTGLALRELWISFRLLLLLAVHLAAGLSVVVFPALVRPALDRFTLLVAAAAVVGAAVAARSISLERSERRAGWLVTRSISRGTIVVGWFVALGVITLAGLAANGGLAWLTVSLADPSLDVVAFGAVFAGVAGLCLVTLAIGLLLGALLPSRLSVPTAAVGCGVLMIAGWLGDPLLIPLAALRALPDLERPVSIGLQGTGIGLAMTGLVLVGVRIALGRADL